MNHNHYHNQNVPCGCRSVGYLQNPMMQYSAYPYPHEIIWVPMVPLHAAMIQNPALTAKQPNQTWQKCMADQAAMGNKYDVAYQNCHWATIP
ncbi:hypothetical protein [Paenibacillus lemnae]|uniref:Uncharacterized protein n=1 Tax=Paenibacillus lemnae TaxID=1330551 RepID=A0A848M241_PAELE|nr:hypothetical protein [Paenibacillus lemnae]NMO94339.1 hypothetical protein [Paenibacillus lemnae]